MNKQASPTILVLGSTGMLGRTVFWYLKQQLPNTYGTHRQMDNDNFFLFNVDNAFDDFNIIIQQIGHIDYVINCIGVLRDYKDIYDLIKINSQFPHILEKLSENNTFKLFHVSTDAVFSPLQGNVYENSIPFPEGKYGASKYLGETQSIQALSFRTSILGFDPINHKGLLEYVHKQHQTVQGYINQTWSGCTTLQFAQLCQNVIERESFEEMRKLSPVFHFAPITNITKYDIVNEFVKARKLALTVEKGYSLEITRNLSTKFAKHFFDLYENKSLLTVLKDLTEFEDTTVKQ